jgi:hypothetical protein
MQIKMKTIVISRWPVWLKTVLINSNVQLQAYPHTLTLQSSTLQQEIEHHYVCLKQDFHKELDFAERALAVKCFNESLVKLDSMYDIVVFANGININGSTATDDFIYSKQNITVEEVSKLYQQIETPPPSTEPSSETIVETIPVKVEEKLPENQEEENEPEWLKNAINTISLVDTHSQTENFVPNLTTRILDSQNQTVIELEGVLSPKLLMNLATQRVFLPALNQKSVVYVGGTRTNPKIGSWQINLQSFDSSMYTYTSSSSTSVSSRTRRGIQMNSRGRVARINSMKRARR